MRLESEKLALVDAELAAFIISLAGSHPVCLGLLQVNGKILRKLVVSPSSVLKRAWQVIARLQFKGLPVENSGKSKPAFVITPALIGLAVILHNRIALQGDNFNNERELITFHDRTLLNSLPLPRSPSDILSFDLLLSAYRQFLCTDNELIELDSFSSDLLSFSPFTSLKQLDLTLPRPLARVAAEYLSHWPNRDSEKGEGEWWDLVDEILCHPGLAAALRYAWLELPENRLSCLGLGVFLEEIRRRGQNDHLILSFFEAYEFTQKISQTESKAESVSLLDLIASQLSASGDSLSGRRLNQVGNEYFLKFRALLEIVADRGGVPGGYRHLSHDFCFKRLLPLVPLATITGGQRLEQITPTKFSEVRFS